MVVIGVAIGVGGEGRATSVCFRLMDSSICLHRSTASLCSRAMASAASLRSIASLSRPSSSAVLSASTAASSQSSPTSALSARSHMSTSTRLCAATVRTRARSSSGMRSENRAMTSSMVSIAGRTSAPSSHAAVRWPWMRWPSRSVTSAKSRSASSFTRRWSSSTLATRDATARAWSLTALLFCCRRRTAANSPSRASTLSCSAPDVLAALCNCCASAASSFATRDRNVCSIGLCVAFVTTTTGLVPPAALGEYSACTSGSTIFCFRADSRHRFFSAAASSCTLSALLSETVAAARPRSASSSWSKASLSSTMESPSLLSLSFVLSQVLCVCGLSSACGGEATDCLWADSLSADSMSSR
eukprot:PhM_4_TR7790/c0_g1_i1/m.94662